MQVIKGSSMMIKTVRTLIEDGWSFVQDEFDVIISAENKLTGEAVSFSSLGNLKRWLYEKALSY